MLKIEFEFCERTPENEYCFESDDWSSEPIECFWTSNFPAKIHILTTQDKIAILDYPLLWVARSIRLAAENLVLNTRTQCSHFEWGTYLVLTRGIGSQDIVITSPFPGQSTITTSHESLRLAAVQFCIETQRKIIEMVPKLSENSNLWNWFNNIDD
jgi:hypothetical protein